MTVKTTDKKKTANAAFGNFVYYVSIRASYVNGRRFRVSDFHHIRHMKVVRSSAPRTGRLYSQEVFLVLILTWG
jgi:hypothetical protein